jgi:hypothetical protein
MGKRRIIYMKKMRGIQVNITWLVHMIKISLLRMIEKNQSYLKKNYLLSFKKKGRPKKG